MGLLGFMGEEYVKLSFCVSLIFLRRYNEGFLWCSRTKCVSFASKLFWVEVHFLHLDLAQLQ